MHEEEGKHEGNTVLKQQKALFSLIDAIDETDVCLGAGQIHQSYREMTVSLARSQPTPSLFFFQVTANRVPVCVPF